MNPRLATPAVIRAALGTVLSISSWRSRPQRGVVIMRGEVAEAAASMPTRKLLPYVASLDGLRAIAVLAVLLYHAEPGWMPGGFLGVEVFFVISGFLITSLLISERASTGALNLGGFWKRRARRLLPALVAMLIGVLAYSAVFLQTEVASLREDALAAFGYVSNWYLIFDEQSYFESLGRPSPLRHLWSLAVEEQFYLAWPLLFALVFGKLKPAVAAPVLLAGAVTSSVLMAVMYDPAHDPSRVYYGTDTRLGGLFVGAALAFVWAPGRLPRRFVAATSRTMDLYAGAALATLVFLLFSLEESAPFLYRGGFLFVAATTAVLIAAAVHPAGRLLPLLGRQPLRYIGLRSYSIYLWHWPVFVFTRPGLDVPLDGLPLLALRFGITLALAEASYRLVETPVRRGLIAEWWRGLRRRVAAPGWQVALRPVVSLGSVIALTALIGFSVVSADRPEPPPYLAVSEYHSTVWSDRSEATGKASTVSFTAPAPAPAAIVPVVTPSQAAPPTSPATTPVPSPEVTAAPTGAPPPSSAGSEGPITAPLATPAPLPAAAPRVFAIGDSVMVGAVGQMQVTIANLEIDAAVGRQVAEGIELLRRRRDAGLLGEVVVVHLGNNGTFTPDQFDEMMGVLAGVPRVVFVTVKVPRDWQGENNAAITEGAGRYPNAILVDWYGSSSPHPEYFWEDGIHLRPDGASQFASLVAAPVNAP